MPVPFIIAMLLVVSLIFLILFEYRKNAKLGLVFKSLCSLCFVAAAIHAYIIKGLEGIYTPMIISGLVFSFFGDILLVYGYKNIFFIAGLACFLVTQIIYGIAFTLTAGIYLWDVILFTALIAILLFAYKALKMDVGSLKLPVLLYMLAIVYMLSKAVSLLYNDAIPLTQAGMVASGALLFVISDAILALAKFNGKVPKSFPALNLLTYYTGQILIASSLYFSA